jgi:hypothetical protein
MSSFTASLVLEAVEAEGKAVTKNGRQLWQVTRDLTYELGSKGSGVCITVPAGFYTDLASIPRLMWTLFPPDGQWVKAAVIHDYLYLFKGLGIYSRAQADAIFLEAMEVLGVSWAQRSLIYRAVRIGGNGGWGS